MKAFTATEPMQVMFLNRLADSGLIDRIEIADQHETLYVRRGDTHFIEAKKAVHHIPDEGKKVEEKEIWDKSTFEFYYAKVAELSAAIKQKDDVITTMQQSIDALTADKRTLLFENELLHKKHSEKNLAICYAVADIQRHQTSLAESEDTKACMQKSIETKGEGK